MIWGETDEQRFRRLATLHRSTRESTVSNDSKLAMGSVDQYRKMLSECVGPPHYALTSDEVDRVAYAMQRVWGSAIAQGMTAVRRAMAES